MGIWARLFNTLNASNYIWGFFRALFDYRLRHFRVLTGSHKRSDTLTNRQDVKAFTERPQKAGH